METEKDRKADREDHQLIPDDSITQEQLGSADTQRGTFSIPGSGDSTQPASLWGGR